MGTASGLNSPSCIARCHIRSTRWRVLLSKDRNEAGAGPLDAIAYPRYEAPADILRWHGTRFNPDEADIGILKEHEAGVSVADLRRKHGVSDATVYKWKAKYGGMDVSEAKRLKGLEDENTRLKRLLADAMLDNAALKDRKRSLDSTVSLA